MERTAELLVSEESSAWMFRMETATVSSSFAPSHESRLLILSTRADFAIVGDEFLKSYYSIYNYAAPGTGAPAVGFATNV